MALLKRITFDVSLYGLLLLLSTTLVYQTWANYRAQSRRPQRVITLDKNGRVPAIAGRWAEGSSAVIDFGKETRPVMLYVFSPRCHWCSRNRENLRAIVATAKDTHRIIGISILKQGLAEYLDREKLGFPVLVDVSAESAKAWNFAATPQTIVVEPGGRLLQNWVGAYGKNGSEVSAYFGVKLPGLPPEPDALEGAQ